MPHKEKRRIIRVGTTSFGVILPMAWLRYYGFPSEVEVISNDEVVIKPLKKKVN